MPDKDRLACSTGAGRLPTAIATCLLEVRARHPARVVLRQVQAQVTEVEEEIQDPGVLLGDFNAENGFVRSS